MFISFSLSFPREPIGINLISELSETILTHEEMKFALETL